jgi:hypothetical protein
MPDTGERNENTQYMNAKESETVQEAKELVLKNKELSDNQNRANLMRRSKTSKARPRQKGMEIQS